MKLLLLCLGLTLVCAHHGENHDVVTSNFNMSKISGEWHTILLASDVKEKIEEQGSMRMFMESIQALDNSSLLIICHKKINGECAELTSICDETEEEGVYSVSYDGYNKLYISEADYNDYLILYLMNSNKQKKTQVTALLARKPDVSTQMKKRFEELCKDHGIPKENILDMANAKTHLVSLWEIRGCWLTVLCSASADPCSHARGSHGAQASSAQ
ncbi:major allergen Equ c 1-like isoform X2 [Phyllostomus discolor]|uniref:Major allergen Equ c 1-like isoform X1 n=1 Tax=Phyllostomus discolor TaxID=89673 RepID=A0A7E6DFZ7_9CHIR|nr:major allergen Equ c 1-like isoform X1 [Phyllostomus discolor]XP_035877959.1 major allergen Equ c 1-like isoform X2 [Phyllostomus discolor]